jgi:hypothetical protein
MRLPTSCLLAAAATALVAAPPADAFTKAVIPKTDVPFFTSPYGLAAGDVNGTEDLYFRRDGVTHLVSDGTSDHEYKFVNASKDGSTAFFFDEDGRLLVRSPAGLRTVASAADPHVSVDAIAPDGSRAFLETAAALDPQDVDSKLDVYEYTVASGTFTLLSKTTARDAHLAIMFPNGSTVFWSSDEMLTADDSDKAYDFFVTSGSTVLRVSPGNGEHGAHIKALSQNSGRMVFETSEPLVAADTDSEVDLYSSVGLTPTLLTPSPNAAADAKPVNFEAAARSDAGRVIFTTAERLTAGDLDAGYDVYATEGGAVSLLTPGTGAVWINDVSDDAGTVLLQTASKLLGTDTDNELDHYLSIGGALTHVLKTNTPFAQANGRLSPDGSVTAFETSEPVSEADGDQMPDVYVRTADSVALASGRAAGAPAGADTEIELSDVLPGGEALFAPTESLHPADTNAVLDLYAFTNGQLSLVSVDEYAPETTMATSGQGVFTSTLAATEQATFECRVDGAAWSACTSPWTTAALPAGEHLLEARATDVAGNADASPAAKTVTVAGPETTDLPVTTLKQTTSPARDAIALAVAKAKVRLRKRVPTLTYTLSEAATVRVVIQRKAGRKFKTLRTKLLSGRAGANRSKLAKLPRRGSFRLVLTATDAAGNTSPKLVLRPSGR